MSTRPFDYLNPHMDYINEPGALIRTDGQKPMDGYSGFNGNFGRRRRRRKSKKVSRRKSKRSKSRRRKFSKKSKRKVSRKRRFSNKNKNNDLIVTTTDNIPGKKIRILGIVMGPDASTSNVAKEWFASTKITGGPSDIYTNLMLSSATTAYDTVVQNAKALGADAIVGLKYQTNTMAPDVSSYSELLAYGTAVKFV
jgi:uncharacterized protein YbjQ (UPF0145 family)